MHELPESAQFEAVESLLEEILHRFYIVVGGAFEGLDLLGICGIEVFKNRVEIVDFVFFEGL